MQLLARGPFAKMHTTHMTPVVYRLALGDSTITVNDLIGTTLRIRYLGLIHCVHCGRRTRKSFNQGYCYPCFQRLAQCDRCIMSPEHCHYHQGTCREPAWGDAHCMREHIVYLANSSGLKVGITRATQIPSRWMDQGAVAALPIARVASRHLSGLMEAVLRRHISDRTNWRVMLRGIPEPVDLAAAWRQLHEVISADLAALRAHRGEEAIRLLNDADSLWFDYPIRSYPDRIHAHNLDRETIVEGRLTGIKGQYLILDTGVLNVRKFTAYGVELSACV